MAVEVAAVVEVVILELIPVRPTLVVVVAVAVAVAVVKCC